MKMFQITEDDLAELERVIPDVCAKLQFSAGINPQSSTQIRRLQKIMTDIRWNYGPYQEIKTIPADGGDST